jgi:NAD(P)H-nitrite reductase large subunit
VTVVHGHTQLHPQVRSWLSASHHPKSPGVRPDTALAKTAGLELGARGGIRVDEHMRTSDPVIYAVGECHCHCPGLVLRLLQQGDAGRAPRLAR